MPLIKGFAGAFVTVEQVGGTWQENPVPGTIDVALCGYGSEIPRVTSNWLGGAPGMGARITQLHIPINTNGQFQFWVYPNEVIAPPGTYYTVTIRNENGDIQQINAYVFRGGADVDLTITEPFDPTLPPGPLAPLIINQLYIVPFETPVTFPCGVYTSFSLTLIGDAGAIYTGIAPGNVYTFIIKQDSIGGHIFYWDGPLNASTINPAPNGVTIQSFIADEEYNLYPVSSPTWTNP
jgi:hypothetical protein